MSTELSACPMSDDRLVKLQRYVRRVLDDIKRHEEYIASGESYSTSLPSYPKRKPTLLLQEALSEIERIRRSDACELGEAMVRLRTSNNQTLESVAEALCNNKGEKRATFMLGIFTAAIAATPAEINAAIDAATKETT